MASSDTVEIWPLIALNKNGGSFILRQIFKKFIQLNHNTKEPTSALNDNKYFFKCFNRHAIKQKVFPKNTKADINDWDITVLCYVIKNCCSIDGKIERSKLEKLLNENVRNIEDYITQKKAVISSELKNKISESQKNILYPKDKEPTTLEYWDASLLVRVLIVVNKIDKSNILPKVIQHLRSRVREAVVYDAKLGTPSLDGYLKKHMNGLLKAITEQSEISRAQFDKEVQQPDINNLSNDVIIFIALNVWPTLKLESSISIKQIGEERNILAHLPSTIIDKTKYDNIWERQIELMNQLVNNEIQEETDKWKEIVKESKKTDSAEVLAEHTKQAKHRIKRKTIEEIKEILEDFSKREDFHLIKTTFTVDYLMKLFDVGADDTDENIKQKFKDGDDDVKPILISIADRGGAVTIKDGSIVLSIQVESLKNLKKIIEYLTVCDGGIQRQLDQFTKSLKNKITLSGEITDYSLQTIKETLESTKEDENLTQDLTPELKKLNYEMNRLVLYEKDDDFEGDEDLSEQSSDESDDEDYDPNDRIDKSICTRSKYWKDYRSEIGSKVDKLNKMLKMLSSYEEELGDLYGNIKYETARCSEMLNECDSRCVIIKGNNNSRTNEIVNLMFKTHLLPVGHTASFSGFIRIVKADHLAVGNTKAEKHEMTNERVSARFVRNILKKKSTNVQQDIQNNWPFSNNMLLDFIVIVDTGGSSTTKLLVTEYMPRALLFAYIVNAAPSKTPDMSEIKDIKTINEEMRSFKQRTMTNKYAQFFLNRWDFIEWEEEDEDCEEEEYLKEKGWVILRMSKDELYDETMNKLKNTWPNFQTKQATKISFITTVGRRSNWLVAKVDDGERAIMNVAGNAQDNLMAELNDIGETIDNKKWGLLNMIDDTKERIEKNESKKNKMAFQLKEDFDKTVSDSTHMISDIVTSHARSISRSIDAKLVEEQRLKALPYWTQFIAKHSVFSGGLLSWIGKTILWLWTGLPEVDKTDIARDINDKLSNIQAKINIETVHLNQAQAILKKELAKLQMNVRGSPLREIKIPEGILGENVVRESLLSKSMHAINTSTIPEIISAPSTSGLLGASGKSCTEKDAIETMTDVRTEVGKQVTDVAIWSRLDIVSEQFQQECANLIDSESWRTENTLLSERSFENFRMFNSICKRITQLK